ncbi:MAG: hypothetical protein NVSMB66_4310 [Candidatus Doudnabacteria bacterium]
MRILISGATKGLGEALVKEALLRYPKAQIVGFSRDQENIDTARKQLEKDFPSDAQRVHLIRGDIGTPQGVAEVFERSKSILGAIDLLVNNVGIFDFDRNLSSVPEEDWQLSESEFEGKYAAQPDFEKKKKYRRMVQANYFGNKNLLEVVANESKITEQELSILEVGSIGVVAELAGKPFEGTSHYGYTKAHLAHHTMDLAQRHDFIKVAVVHPGPFGRSAQLIADEYGDTWAIDPADVAKHSFDLYDQLEHSKFVQGIIVAEEHFAIKNKYFGKVDALGIEGLSAKHSLHIPSSRSMHLRRKEV